MRAEEAAAYHVTPAVIPQFANIPEEATMRPRHRRKNISSNDVPSGFSLPPSFLSSSPPPSVKHAYYASCSALGHELSRMKTSTSVHLSYEAFSSARKVRHGCLIMETPGHLLTKASPKSNDLYKSHGIRDVCRSPAILMNY